MRFTNLLLAIDTPTDIVDWITVGIVALGLCLFFGDFVISIKKRRNIRLNIIGLVFITLAIVSFILTEVFTDMALIFSFVSIAFLVAYFVCNVVITVCIAKQNKREKKNRKNESSNGADIPADDSSVTHKS